MIMSMEKNKFEAWLHFGQPNINLRFCSAELIASMREAWKAKAALLLNKNKSDFDSLTKERTDFVFWLNKYKENTRQQIGDMKFQAMFLAWCAYRPRTQ